MLRRALTVEQCIAAVEECGAPVVSIFGGEPLLYPHVGELVAELTRRRKYVYLCTNALLLKEKLEQDVFTPSERLTFSVQWSTPPLNGAMKLRRSYESAFSCLVSMSGHGWCERTWAMLFNNRSTPRCKTPEYLVTAL